MKSLFVKLTVCLFVVVGLLAGVSRAALAQQELSASIVPAENGVDFYLTNNTDSSLSVLRWETPLEAELTQDIFSVVPSKNGKPHRFGRRAVFSGRVFKRHDPTGDDYLVMQPGETVMASVPLTNFYRLDSDGLHTARFTGQFKLLEQSNADRSVRSHTHGGDGKVIVLQTNAVAVNLTAAPVPAFARLGSSTGCSASQQADLPGDLDASERITLQALNDLQQLPENERAGSPRYLRWFGTYSASRYSTVVQTYEKAAARMADGSVEFSCTCDASYQSVFAYVFPIDPFKVYLCDAYWAAAQTGTDSRAGTILHELSHFPEVAGTRDHAYGTVTVANLATTSPDTAVNNADSIEYFAENTPFYEISAGETVETQPQLVDYRQLQAGAVVSGSVVQGETNYFQVSGADAIELTTVSGDADLSVYSTAARDNLLCESDSSGALDLCDISSASTAYIAVFGYRDSSYSIVATTSTPLVTRTLELDEVVTGTLASGEDNLFVVTGADVVEITSLSGDADLYVHSDASRSTEVCSSLAYSNMSVNDSCQLSGGTSYITVHGFEASEYTIVARALNLVNPDGSDDGSDTTVDGGDTTVDGGDTTVDGGDTTVDGGDTTVDGGDTTVDGSDTTVDDGETTVDSGESTGESGDSTVNDEGTTGVGDAGTTTDDTDTPVMVTGGNSPDNESTGGSGGGVVGAALIAMLGCLVCFRRFFLQRMRKSGALL